MATTTHSSNTGTSATGSGSVETQRATISRRLPTRMSKTMTTTSTMTDCDELNAGIESRQDSQVNDTFDRCDDGTSDGPGASIAIITPDKCHGEEDGRIQTPKEEILGAPLEPAFVLKDIDTIDHPQYKNLRASSPHHQSSQQRHHMRSPSPGHGSVISRRGRSRSPVGLTPHHHRAGSNSRAPSAVTVQAGVGSQGELSSAALAAGEAAASNLAASYQHHHHHHSTIKDSDTGAHHFPASPQRLGRRSPSPVSRFPSLTSQSFEISPQHSMKAEGLMGSFDWNVGSTLQQHQQQQYPYGDSKGRGDDRLSPLMMVPDAQTQSHQQSGGDRQYHDPYSNGVGGDQYYSNYSPSYPYYQTNENNSMRNNIDNSNHPRHPPHQTVRGRSPSPTYRNQVIDDRQHRHHHLVNHDNYHDRKHARSNDPAIDAGWQVTRRSSQQALFPEHHILSSHSRDRNDVRPHHHAAPASSSSPTSDRREGPSRKSKRGGSRDNGRSNNTEIHRSSVFRGSLSERGAGERQRHVGSRLPQELLLALEEDEDNEDATLPHALAESEPTISSNTDNSTTRDLPKAASPSQTLVANPSMLEVMDPMQIDNILMQESMTLNDYDDYLTGSLSFRKSYDLGQVFSFIKEGGSSGAHGQLSFTLGLSSESNEEVDPDRSSRSNNNVNNHGNKGNRALYGSQSMGLTPINSFSCGNNKQGNNDGIVPLSSIDGMSLRAFFSSSPNTTGSPLLGDSSSPTEGSLIKIGSPQMTGGAYNPSQSETAPVVHASTPPSYSHHGSGMQYGPLGSHGMISHCTYSNMETPPHGPSLGSYHNSSGLSRSSMQGTISMSFPSKRIKLSTKHSVHPLAMDLSRRLGGDHFVLLRKLAPCFANFRFKLPELESSSVDSMTCAVVPEVARNGKSLGLRNPSGFLQAHMIIAKRRISSSICAFGGSLPPRTVSPSPSSESLSPDSPGKLHGAHHNTSTGASTCEEDFLQEREERLNYEQSLSGRYFMKETCISWDVELHEVITPQIGDGRRGQKKAGVGGKSMITTSEKRQIGVFKKGSTQGNTQQLSPSYCAPVTPSSPSDYHDERIHGLGTTHGGISLSGYDPNSSHPQSTQEKGTKVKYRCKLCGQPKQNHTCSYQSAMVRSIGTMVYPAVNAFVSNEPGRLAPALSEMNNFTSLLSQDTSTAGGSQLGNMNSFGGPYRPPPHPTHRRGPCLGNQFSHDLTHWSPNTPGGLSTMSSKDPNSPGVSAVGTPVGLTSHGGGIRKQDHNQTLMSRSMNYSMPTSHSGPPPTSVPRAPSMPPAPAGAIPSDVLFRDTMELKREQFRTVGATSANASTNGGCSGDVIVDPPNAFRYPPIPTPYSQRKELGDTLFAMSREVPSLADSCAAILREARENDEWDQAVAELTTQVLVVIKCEEQDYTLEGLRRHLMTLGIAC